MQENYEDIELHQLIGDIYEASIDHSHWPVLVHRIADVLSLHQGPALHLSLRDIPKHNNGGLLASSSALGCPPALIDSRIVSRHRNSTLSKVLNIHLDRAYSIAEAVTQSESRANALRNALEHMPIPIVIVDEQLTVIAANAKASSTQGPRQAYSLADGQFSFKAAKHDHILKASIERCLLDQETAIYKPEGLRGINKVTLICNPLQLSQTEPSRYVAILVADHSNEVALSDSALQDTYGITPAESRLINELVQGESLKEISSKRHVSMNTLRTHLKSVFGKMGVKRQAELVKCVLLGPNRYLEQSKVVAPFPTIVNRASSNLAITLRDGRVLAYAEYGDPNGKPVIGCHPTTGSRYQIHPNENVLHTLGIRFIVPDRPGFGRSSAKTKRQFTCWPNDLSQLLAHLSIDKYSLFAYCGGTPFALAAAAAMPERSKQVLLVSPVTPYDKIDLFLGMRTPNRLMLDFASRLPDSVFRVGRLIASSLVRNPERYFDDIIGSLCDTDAEALNEPEFLDNFKLALQESLRQGPQEFVYEQVLMSQDWAINLERVQCPVTIWHGEEDQHVPIKFSERLATNFPKVNFVRKPNYGHFMIYQHWQEFFLEVVA